MGDFIEGQGLVMFPDDCFVQHTGIKTGQWQVVPSGLWGYVREETHSAGSVTGVIIPWSTIF